MSWSQGPGRRRKSPDRVPFLLDKFSAKDIDRWNRFRDAILRFHWDYYNSLTYQRSQISEDLSKALLGAAEGAFQFSKWQRIVTYKHAVEPLSLLGSLVDPGGRFNIGDINSVQFPPFPALYAAVDKHTALQEVLSRKIPTGMETQALDSALIRPDSITVVSVSGHLDSVINLRHPERLEVFLDLVKEFSIPGHLIQMAKTLGVPPPKLVRDRANLLEVLLDPNWRSWPMQFDVPAPCQLFGQLVAKAGIEGIVYPSKFGGKDCLAIFPQNFEDADVFVQLDDVPPPGVQVRRLDATTWRKAAQPSQSHESLLMRLMRIIQGSAP